MNLFGTPQGAPDIDWVELPTSTGQMTPHPVIWPHKFFRALFNDRREWWHRYVQGPEGAAVQYWRQVSKFDFVKKHPRLRRNMWASTIPIGMHGDAGAFNRHDGLMVLSWNSLLGHGPTQRKRFVFTFIKKKDYTPETLNALWRLFAWSLNAMLDGRSPLRDWCDRPTQGGGEELAGGWQACLCQVRGDWQFYCEIFAFPKWNNAVRMCWICLASASIVSLSFKRCSRDAAWRRTRFSHESYIAELQRVGGQIPELFKHVIGLRLECIVVDVLHALDLGVAATIVGNILWETVAKKMWGGSNQDANVALLEKYLRAWEKKTNATKLQGALTAERLRNSSGYPKLKAKGAATRHLAPYALAVARKFDSGSQHDRTKVAIAQLLCKLYNIMSSSGQFFAPDALEDFESAGRGLVQLLSGLHAASERDGVKSWKFAPKAHLIDHLATYQAKEWGNPSYYWTYADEDLVGLCVEIAQSVHTNTMAVNALVKWLILAFDEPAD